MKRAEALVGDGEFALAAVIDLFEIVQSFIAGEIALRGIGKDVARLELFNVRRDLEHSIVPYFWEVL